MTLGASSASNSIHSITFDNKGMDGEPREYPEWIIPHAEFGDPECPGLLFGEGREDGQADIACNDCGFVLESVPASDVRRTLDELQLKLAVASEMCPHCGSVNLFPGFDRMLAYTCRQCGKGVKLEREA
jgi:DNA-directed RNA polymerase subunit RPC12/RpoP